MYIDISEVPAGLATLLTTSTAIAALILCLTIFFISCVPFVFVMRGREVLIPVTLIAIVECFAFAMLGWVEWWLAIITVMGVAGVFALLVMKDVS
jgi:hypothetical protein